MRLATSRWLAIAAWALVLAAAPSGAAAPGEPPARSEVQAAVEKLKANPDLGGTHKQKTLRFKDTEKEKKKPDPPDRNALRWIQELFDWIAQTSRVLVWVLGAVAIALLLVSMHRWVRAREPGHVGPRPILPSHVRNLDIRPESLPDAIGAAAAALWREGQHLPALSLLYRGALSRLVHVHGVPIGNASTEDECASLAKARLDAVSGDFVAALVAAWQLAVYGARLPETERVMVLCRDFDLHLRLAPAAGPAGVSTRAPGSPLP